MILYWRGGGLIVPVVIVISVVAGVGLSMVIMGDECIRDNFWIVPASVGIGGLILIPLGKSMARNIALKAFPSIGGDS